jgi:hypothetical protein
MQIFPEDDFLEKLFVLHVDAVSLKLSHASGFIDELQDESLFFDQRIMEHQTVPDTDFGSAAKIGAGHARNPFSQIGVYSVGEILEVPSAEGFFFPFL